MDVYRRSGARLPGKRGGVLERLAEAVELESALGSDATFSASRRVSRPPQGLASGGIVVSWRRGRVVDTGRGPRCHGCRSACRPQADTPALSVRGRCPTRGLSAVPTRGLSAVVGPRGQRNQHLRRNHAPRRGEELREPLRRTGRGRPGRRLPSVPRLTRSTFVPRPGAAQQFRGVWGCRRAGCRGVSVCTRTVLIRVHDSPHWSGIAAPTTRPYAPGTRRALLVGAAELDNQTASLTRSRSSSRVTSSGMLSCHG